jgi:hypothetical protein
MQLRLIFKARLETNTKKLDGGFENVRGRHECVSSPIRTDHFQA